MQAEILLLLLMVFFVVTIGNIMVLSHVIMFPNYLISKKNKSYNVLVTCYL